MEHGTISSEVCRQLRNLVFSLLSVLIDAVFLSIWVGVQWLVQEFVVAKLELHFIDKWVLEAFQRIFAVSTLSVVIIWYAADIIAVLIHAWSTVVVLGMRAGKTIKREKGRVLEPHNAESKSGPDAVQGNGAQTDNIQDRDDTPDS